MLGKENEIICVSIWDMFGFKRGLRNSVYFYLVIFLII